MPLAGFAFLKDVAENLIAAASEASIGGAMAFGPPGSGAFFRAHMPPSIALHEAWYPNFGDCLKTALRGQFAAGHTAACVLNSDSPTLPISLLIETANVLAEPGDRAVLGPSADGGYYLLALKTMHTHLFEDIAWSTSTVAAQTLVRAAEIGLPVRMLATWYDVDDSEAMMLLMGELLEGRPFSQDLRPSPAPHTTALLQWLVRSARLKYRLERHASHAAHELEEAGA